jgi:hypothetical protein
MMSSKIVTKKKVAKSSDMLKDITNSQRVLSNGVDNDKLYKNQQNLPADNKLQIRIQNNVNFTDLNGEDSNKINRLGSPQCQDSTAAKPTNQFTAQHEHRTSIPFSNNTYAAFKKGNVVRGILCPSLTNSFRWVSTNENVLSFVVVTRVGQEDEVTVSIIHRMLIDLIVFCSTLFTELHHWNEVIWLIHIGSDRNHW